MNEFDFRKRLLENPTDLDEEMLAFLNDNPDQEQILKHFRLVDQRIQEALHVEAPEGLQARILLNQSYQNLHENSESTAKPLGRDSEPKEPSEMASAWLPWSYFGTGLAASLLVALLVLGPWKPLPFGERPISGDAMVVHILEHIEADPSLMLAQTPPHSPEQLQSLFASVGASLKEPIDSMSYAGECEIEGRLGLHIVMQEETGPVTVIVMPGQKLAAIEAFRAGGYSGELIPVKGGMVAIIGNSMEQLALAQARFFKAVRFG